MAANRVFIILLLLASANCLSQNNAPKASLPLPDGSYSVGRSWFLWSDPSRHEDPAAASGGARHVPAYLYYPAARSTNAAEYYPNLGKITAKEAKSALAGQFGDAWPLVAQDAITTHAFSDAPLPTGKEKFPVLLFSPGQGLPAAAYSAQLENLASNGYVVIALEHPYNTAVVALADGTAMVAKAEPAGGPPTMEGLHKELEREDVWVEDTQFVLKHLSDFVAERPQFKGRLDLTRLGIFGHSMGGKVAVRICQKEQTMHACLNEDGGLFNADAQSLTIVPAVDPAQSTYAPLFNIDVKFMIPPVPDENLRQQIARWQQKKADALAAFLKQNKAATYITYIDAPGFSHLSFTDVPYLAAVAKQGDTQPAQVNLALTNSFTLAFFDAILKQNDERLKQLISKPAPGVSIQKIQSGAAP